MKAAAPLPDWLAEELERIPGWQWKEREVRRRNRT